MTRDCIYCKAATAEPGALLCAACAERFSEPDEDAHRIDEIAAQLVDQGWSYDEAHVAACQYIEGGEP